MRRKLAALVVISYGSGVALLIGWVLFQLTIEGGWPFVFTAIGVLIGGILLAWSINELSKGKAS